MIKQNKQKKNETAKVRDYGDMADWMMTFVPFNQKVSSINGYWIT